MAGVAFMVAAVGVGAVVSDRGSAEGRVREYVSGAGDKEFFAADLQFRATFPRVPDRSTQVVRPDGRDHEVVSYMADLGDTTFAVSAVDLPGDAAGDLNMAVNGAAAGVAGHVESAQMTTFEGFPAAEYLVSVPGRAFVKGFIIHAGARLYQLQVVGPVNPPSGYDHFKQSFQLARS
jgi:hypothetical protein